MNFKVEVFRSVLRPLNPVTRCVQFVWKKKVRVLTTGYSRGSPIQSSFTPLPIQLDTSATLFLKTKFAMVLETPISKDKKYHLLMLERASNYLVHHFAFNTLLGLETVRLRWQNCVAFLIFWFASGSIDLLSPVSAVENWLNYFPDSL